MNPQLKNTEANTLSFCPITPFSGRLDAHDRTPRCFSIVGSVGSSTQAELLDDLIIKSFFCMKEKIVSFIKRRYVWIIITIMLITTVNLFFQKQDLRFSLINYQAIPSIKLTNTLGYSSSSNSFLGDATGFVKLEEKNSQPKDLRQYYVIQPTSQRDKNSNQVLILDEIVVLPSLSPESIGKTKLIKSGENGNKIILEDENGLRFFFNRDSREISMEDARLITSDSEYRDFMRNFLRK